MNEGPQRTKPISIMNSDSKFTSVLRASRMKSALLLTATLATAWVTSNTAQAAGHIRPPHNPGVIPIQAHYAGLTYAEWSTRWWQWASRTLTINSPALDSTGAHVAEGQSGPVWFLIWQEDWQPVVRTATIPGGKALLFTATNQDPYFLLPPDATLEQRIAAAVSVFDNIVEPGAELDGVPIVDIDSYRVVSDPYTFSFTEDNLFGLPAGEYGPTVNAGNYILLKPLSAGAHNLHIHYKFNAGGQLLSNDVTYRLAVLPE
jgi:hypothetical protein